MYCTNSSLSFDIKYNCQPPGLSLDLIILGVHPGTSSRRMGLQLLKLRCIHPKPSPRGVYQSSCPKNIQEFNYYKIPVRFTPTIPSPPAATPSSSLRQYSDYTAHLHRIHRGEPDVLSPGPAPRLAMTSATAGEPKFLPETMDLGQTFHRRQGRKVGCSRLLQCRWCQWGEFRVEKCIIMTFDIGGCC